MTVLSVSIVESLEEIVSGIPRFVNISTNIPTTIFYTLDGTDPTILSNIYIDTLSIPQNQLSITLKVLATNGIIYSPIITEIYQTNILQNARLSHALTDARPEISIPSLYPFGTNTIEPIVEYLNPGDTDLTVNNIELSQISTAYDGNGNQTSFVNELYNSENYDIIYSERNVEGEYGKGLNTSPSETTVLLPTVVPESSNQFTNLFNPRALVIYQDFTKQNPDDPQVVNKQFFCLENFETFSDGNMYFNNGLDAAPISGAFVRSGYNPTTNTMNYYYLDNLTRRWIISTIPCPKTAFDGNYASNMVFSRDHGVGVVYEWLNYTRRILF